MTSVDLERLRKELRDFDRIDFISDDMRAVIGVKSYPASSRNA
jgi:hypothetical protein